MTQLVMREPDLLLKLSSVSILLTAAKEKVLSYMESNDLLTVQLEEADDQDAWELFALYYEDNKNELIQAASESLISSKEAETAILEWLNQYEAYNQTW